MNPLARTVLGLLLVPVALYVFVCVVLYATQRSHIYFPVPRMLDAVPFERLKTDAGDAIVSVRAHEGTKAVVYFGGNAEDVSQSIPELDVAFPDRALYALHFRGYGGSAGTPTEAGLVADGLALFDRVHETHPDVVLVGRSLGSGVAVQVAAARPASRLVLVTPYDSLATVAASHYPIFPVRWLMKDHFDSMERAPKLRLPTTIIAAGRDEVIPMDSTRRLEAAFAPGVVTFVLLPNVGHNFGVSQPYLDALRGSP